MAIAAVEPAFLAMLILLIAEMVVKPSLEQLLQHQGEYVLDVFCTLDVEFINELRNELLSGLSFFTGFFAITKTPMPSSFPA